MLVDGVPRRTIRGLPDGSGIELLDQTALPHRVEWRSVTDLAGVARAIGTMQVRGAPLIGVTAAYGLALAARHDPSDDALRAAAESLAATRPTAVNLRWAVRRMLADLLRVAPAERSEVARRAADDLAEADVAACAAIGRNGLALVDSTVPPRDRPLSVMTHCNAGWLATVDRGTALAPVYRAVEAGREVHVWVSETRPRNQGLLTVWELTQQGVPCTLIADNAAGALIRAGRVDVVLVGADRIAANGDVANKVGTYLKALACADGGVPCHVLAPTSTIDPACPSGDDIPIEERSGDEVRTITGASVVRLVPAATAVANPAFDVTPARLVTSLVTETGVAPATPEGVRLLLSAAPPAAPPVPGFGPEARPAP
jgi:methylthioribose-1-phosphate isomerase